MIAELGGCRPNEYFDRNFYQEVREGFRGVVGQDVGRLHREASFGDRALLLEFESGFASREGPAGARYVRDAAARAERYSAETDVEVLVAPVRTPRSGQHLRRGGGGTSPDPGGTW